MSKKEIKALLGTLFFVVLSSGLYLLIRVYFGIQEDSLSFIALLLLPVLVYLILMDKLQAFKAGGIEATFREMAESAIKIDNQEIVEDATQDVSVLRKGSISQLERQLPHLKSMDESKKFIYTIVSGKSNFYQLEALRVYIHSLMSIPNFKFVVIVDLNNKVVAYARIYEFAQLLREDKFGRDLLQLLSEGDNEKIRKLPSFLSKTASEKTKNMEALKTMDELNLEELIIVDDQDHLKGIIEREKILTKLMIALSK